MVAEVSSSSNQNGKPKRAKQAIGVSPISGTAPPVATRWKPGQSGNPAGRLPAGLTVKEWWNQLQDATRTHLEKIVNDPDAPSAKVAAAVDWLTARSLDRTSSGAPINGGAVERIIDHTAGKAAQSVDVTSNGETVALLPIRLDGDREL